MIFFHEYNEETSDTFTIPLEKECDNCGSISIDYKQIDNYFYCTKCIKILMSFD